jgi:sugar phosphate isomerase/epimerase
MDIGHQNVFSELDAIEWVRRMGRRLSHIHLHDNDGKDDTHWPIGRGTIDFEPFYAILQEYVPGGTISLEVEDKMEVKMNDLRMLAARFGNNHHSSFTTGEPAR